MWTNKDCSLGYPQQSLLKKQSTVYMNSRAAIYSPNYSFLEKRSHSQEKVISKYNLKKKMLIDQQLTHLKTIIAISKIAIENVSKPLSQSLSQQLKQFAIEVELRYKNLLNYCKNRTFTVQNRERNYSEPKYKPKTSHKQFPKRQYQNKSLKDRFFFLDSYQLLEESILVMKFITTSSLEFLDFGQNLQDSSFFKRDLWQKIRMAIDDVKKQAEIDIFAKEVILSSLKKYYQFLKQQKNGLIDSLFLDFEIQPYVTTKELKKIRFEHIRKRAKQIGIEVHNERCLNFDRIFYNFKKVYKRVPYFQRTNLLTRVCKISRMDSAGAEGKYYKVQYFLGLERIFDQEQLWKIHPQQFQHFLKKQ